MVFVAWIQDNFDKVQNVQNFKGKYRRDVGSHSMSGTLYWCKVPKLMSDNDTLLSVHVLGLHLTPQKPQIFLVGEARAW